MIKSCEAGVFLETAVLLEPMTNLLLEVSFKSLGLVFDIELAANI